LGCVEFWPVRWYILTGLMGMRKDTNMKKLLFVLAFMSLVLPAALAQTSTTGSIAGTVTDPSGAAVPDIMVTATSPNLIQPKSATTDSNGRYSMLGLPPGKYSISVAAEKGFAKFEQNNVEVNLGRTTSGDLQLQVGGVAAEVSVTAGAPVDVAQTTAGNNVSTDQFSNFPTQRTVQGLYNIAPTVARSGLRDATGRDRDPSVAGSSGPENNYILDGVSTTDPAYGGGGANLPFEFIQEVEIKTGAFGAEYGKATGGIFNVVTKSGGNEIHGDVFGYGTSQGLVRGVKNFPFTGAAANGFSEADIGGDIGGPIKKDKLWYFAAANPQWRTNHYLTQSFHQSADNKVTVPFYAGKVTASINSRNILTVSTFSDFVKIDGFLSAIGNFVTNSCCSGFGSDVNAFLGKAERGGQNYAFRLNSTISPRFIAEFAGGLHFQRYNDIPRSSGEPLVSDNFAVLRNGAVLTPTQTGIATTANNNGTGFIDYVDGRGGLLQRTFFRGPGFSTGIVTNQDRNRYEFAARLQNTFNRHNLKWGAEWSNNIYNIQQVSPGGAVTYANPLGLSFATTDNNQTNGARISNAWSVCTVRNSQVICPNATATAVLSSAPGSTLPAGLTVGPTGSITADEASNNPFLVRLSTRVRDFQLHADTTSRVISNYVQDEWKLSDTVQVNLGVRWDYQQSFSNGGGTYIKLNRFLQNAQPRLGAVWDFTGKGRGKFFANFARFLETPIPLDVNVRAGGGDTQIDKNFNVNRLNAPSGSTIVPGIRSSLTVGAVNLGSDATPVDPSLRPQTINEWTAGFEYEAMRDLVVGVRGVYRNQVNVIEDGSFDDGDNYLLFNPGRRGNGETTEDKACGDPTIGCFGHAARYYRALEFTATRRFTTNYQVIASYTYSSLMGNYEGLFRNDNGQSDPNITSLFDLPSLLPNTFGRLPNDRPHQFKFNGSYRTPWKVLVSGNWYIQSGSPFNQLTPHAVYGNNEGFGVQRGTAIVPQVTATQAGFPNVVDSVGTRRTPVTWNSDLGVYYPVRIDEKRELRLQADWFNVFNQQRAVTLDQTYSINSGVTGVPPVSNPFWGAAVQVQPPSQWRFGAKLSF
jgi:outer membrane receptor protein involved in Fe transport